MDSIPPTKRTDELTIQAIEGRRDTRALLRLLADDQVQESAKLRGGLSGFTEAGVVGGVLILVVVVFPFGRAIGNGDYRSSCRLRNLQQAARQGAGVRWRSVASMAKACGPWRGCRAATRGGAQVQCEADPECW